MVLVANELITTTLKITDARASFSNFGPPVDIFAQGRKRSRALGLGPPRHDMRLAGLPWWALPSFPEDPLELLTLLQATPHIAGLVAYLIGLNGNVSPATMSANIKSLALSGVLSGIRTSPTRTTATLLTCTQRPARSTP